MFHKKIPGIFLTLIYYFFITSFISNPHLKCCASLSCVHSIQNTHIDSLQIRFRGGEKSSDRGEGQTLFDQILWKWKNRPQQAGSKQRKRDVVLALFGLKTEDQRTLSSARQTRIGNLKELTKRVITSPIATLYWGLGISKDEGFVQTLASWTSLAITLLCVGLILNKYGVDMTPVVKGLGLTTFVVGFAFKELVTHFLAGVLLVVQRPFRTGWIITVNSFKGKVMSIDTRYVRLLSESGAIVLIPSYTVFASPIVIEDGFSTPEAALGHHGGTAFGLQSSPE